MKETLELCRSQRGKFCFVINGFGTFEAEWTGILQSEVDFVWEQYVTFLATGLNWEDKIGKDYA